MGTRWIAERLDAGIQRVISKKEALTKAILAFSAHGEQEAWFLLTFSFNRVRGRKWRYSHVPRETPI